MQENLLGGTGKNVSQLLLAVLFPETMKHKVYVSLESSQTLKN